MLGLAGRSGPKSACSGFSAGFFTCLIAIMFMLLAGPPAAMADGGYIWGMGLLFPGLLGDEATHSSDVPVQGPGGGVTAVAAGGDRNLYLKEDGSLWGMGDNGDGQLGQGPLWACLRPTLIEGSGVTAVAAGNEHTLYVKTDGSLWAMGDNEYGQLGDGTTTTRYRPVKIVASGVKAVSAGYWHSLFVKTDGSLWAMGDNGHGELGDGTTEERHAPVRVVDSGVEAVACGWQFSIFIKTDGSLWGMGDNASCQLHENTLVDYPTPIQIAAPEVTAASASDDHILFIKSDGSLWGRGSNYLGQLGGNLPSNACTPVQIESSGVTAASAGYQHTIYAMNGALWVTGYNYYGQLGDGTNTNRTMQVKIVDSGVTAVAAGYAHSIYVGQDGGHATYTFNNGLWLDHAWVTGYQLDDAKMQELADLLAAHKIYRVYVHVGVLADDGASIIDGSTTGYAQFLSGMASKAPAVKVYAWLNGSTYAARTCGQAELLRMRVAGTTDTNLTTINNIKNTIVGSLSAFDGVHLDIEPFVGSYAGDDCPNGSFKHLIALLQALDAVLDIDLSIATHAWAQNHNHDWSEADFQAVFNLVDHAATMTYGVSSGYNSHFSIYIHDANEAIMRAADNSSVRAVSLGLSVERGFDCPDIPTTNWFADEFRTGLRVIEAASAKFDGISVYMDCLMTDCFWENCWDAIWLDKTFGANCACGISQPITNAVLPILFPAVGVQPNGGGCWQPEDR